MARSSTLAALLVAHAASADAFAPHSVRWRPVPSVGLAAKKKRPNRGGKGRSTSGGKGFGRPEASTPQSSSVVEVEADTLDSPMHAALLAWLQSNPSTFISPKFAVRPSPLGGYGGFATAPLERGELILNIPRKCCVTFDDALSDQLCGEDFRRIKDGKVNSWGMILIAGWIAKERMLMKQYAANGGTGPIKHEAYLNSVPWERGELGQEHVLFWSEAEVERLLADSLAYEDAMRIRRTVDEATSLLGEFVVPIVKESLRGEQSAVEGEDEDRILEELAETVKGAFVVALSRSFAEEVELDDGTIEVENALLPLIDILQHSNTPNAMLESYDDCILLRARRDVATGEELSHQYQAEDDNIIPPNKWFTRYGFVPGVREPIVELLEEKSPLFFGAAAAALKAAWRSPIRTSRSLRTLSGARVALFPAAREENGGGGGVYFRRGFSSGATADTSSKLRIAVVGGGAAGMTAALHLSPLVAAGLVQGPIDVYESTVVRRSKNRHSGHTDHGHSGGKQLYPGSGAIGRDIGVGIWSTAWMPFLRSLEGGVYEGGSVAHALQQQRDRKSFRTLLQDLESCGSYVKDVGYRTPNGGWLVKSELNASPFGIEALGDSDASSRSIDNDDPALLFVRERDLLSCLRNAIRIERRLGTIQYHSGVRVDGIDNVNGDMGSLVLQSTGESSFADPSDIGDSDLSPQYNLIIAADGLYSPLRSRFAGHHSRHATQTGMEAPGPSKNSVEYNWEHTKGQREATEIEDREYIVFRGNAPKLDVGDEDGSGSFQTWGEKSSMRFAAVPFYHETEDLEDDDDDESNSSGHYSKSQSFNSRKKDEEVWFATISDPTFIEMYKKASLNSSDAVEQKQLLMKAFGSWHKPVQKLIETTPADDIMYEMAIAHRYSATPVFDVARIMEFEKRQQHIDSGNINGQGPALVFIGDSLMTVDPVLAQGFTMAMESGASIAQSIERVLVHPGAAPSSPLAYQPNLLREELMKRHFNREQRLLQLLRSTELVQRLAQPSGFGSFIATWLVRPMVKVCPQVIKKRVFDYMIRYSLGLTNGDGRGKG